MWCCTRGLSFFTFLLFNYVNHLLSSMLFAMLDYCALPCRLLLRKCRRFTRWLYNSFQSRTTTISVFVRWCLSCVTLAEKSVFHQARLMKRWVDVDVHVHVDMVLPWCCHGVAMVLGLENETAAIPSALFSPAKHQIEQAFMFKNIPVALLFIFIDLHGFAIKHAHSSLCSIPCISFPALSFRCFFLP